MNETEAMRNALDGALQEDLVTRANRIQAVKTEVTSKLRRGIPIGITQEMIDLGIADEIAKQLAKAEVSARLRKLYEDEDDELEQPFEPNRPIFF